MEQQKRWHVAHAQQIYSWDCGIACVRMFLRTTNKDESLMDKFMQEINLAKSVWTVDLAYILSRYDISSTLYTLSTEVKDEYSKMSFYKAQFDVDKQRVESLFKDSEQLGFTCEQGHIPLQSLSEKLSDNNALLIALVDWNLMTCADCGGKPLQVCSRLCARVCCTADSYQGHFLLVTDIDIQANRITFHNPGRSSGPCHCSVQIFDTARQAKGTDEDLLLIQIPD